MKNTLILTLLLFLGTLRVYADNLIFNHLSVQDGLSQLSVLSLYQDENGYIWMGTFSGVNIYNGRSFSYMVPEKQLSASIHGNEIKAITGDKKGEVYLLNENGISVIHQDDYSINNIWNNHINAIYMGKSGLWAGIDKNLYILKNNALEKYTLPFQLTSTITAIYENFDHTIFIATSKECLIICPDHSTVNLPIRNGSTFSKTHKGDVWFGTADNGAFLLNPKGEIITHLNSSNGLSNNFVRSIIEDNNQNIWIGTFWGLNTYNPFDKSVRVYTNSLINNNSISNNSIYSLIEDNQKNIWIGTYYGGVNIYYNYINKFKFYDLVNPDQESPKTIIAGCLQEDHKGNLWIATDGSGLKRIDKTGVVHSYTERFGSAEHFNNIKDIYVDKNNDIWLGILLGGLYYCKNEQFTNIPIKIDNQLNSYDANIINDILEFNDDLLLATIDGILLFDKTTHKCSYLFNGSIRQKIGKRIHNLFLDSRNRLWIGTKGEGLSMYDFKARKLHNYKLIDKGDKNQISSNHITEVTEGKDQTIWISTYGGGFNKYDEKYNHFIPFQSKDYGFSTDYLQSIKSMNDTLLIIGGKSSLIIFNLRQKKLDYEVNYKKGFPLEELLERTLCITQNKQLFVAGKNGLVQYVDLNFTQYKTASASLAFDKLYIKNKEVRPNDESNILKKTLRNTKKITLKYNQSSFSIDFAAPNYNLQTQTEYEYMMEEYDLQWRKIVSNESISYTNIPSGTYTLHLRSTSKPEKTSSLIIKVKPYWNATWWAYSIYSLILLSIFAFFMRTRITKRKLMLAQIEKQKIEYANQQKINFFTNISHEFNTPLTLILGHIDDLMQNRDIKQNEASKIKLIQKNALRLKRLISELIEFRKFEQGMFNLSIFQIDFEQYIRQIVQSFKEFADHQHINYDYQTKGNPKPVWIDPSQMEKVFYNILSNAFKFTQSEGTISVEVGYKDAYVIVDISDNGKGIKANDLNRIFDRFYQSSTKDMVINSGFGIGLALAKEIMKLHNGAISVHSKEGEGSTFRVTLLYENSLYDKEFIHEEKWQESFSEIFIANALQETDKHLIETDEEFALKEYDIIGEKPTILIVEDNEELSEYIKSLFKGNYHVLLAFNGKKGFELAKEKKPDIILSDIIMPVMSGTDMCMKLKSDLETSHIPVVLLTAMITENNMISGFQSGANDYICKPFNNRILLMKCANIINWRRNFQKGFSSNVPTLKSLELACNGLDRQFLERVNDFLEKNIENPKLDVTELSQHMYMSRSSFYNKIKELTGLTPLEIINNHRFNKAIEILLVKPKIDMLELSTVIGFNSPKYFSKSFKMKYGCTPSQYIKKMKQEIELNKK